MTRASLFDRLFGIDLRSLAAFRIAAGAVVCVDALTRLPFLTEFYTEAGPVYLSPVEHTLFGLVGEAWWPALWLTVLFVAGALLCVGRWTRVANAVCWALLFDLHRRNPHVIDGGDNFLQHMLFWSLFLPLGAYGSLDARRRAAPAPARVASVGSAALLLQPAQIYLFSALLKLEHPMWRDGTAAFYAVAQDIWARPFADWVAARPGPLTQALTWATLTAELVCPLLFFSPVRTSLARGIAILSLIAMQVGFAVSLELFMFPFISTISLLPLLPSGFWDRLAGPRTALGEPHRPTPSGRTWQGVCAVALALAVLLNLESLLPLRLLPGPLRSAGQTVVAQGWAMYAEIYRYDFRLVLSGRTRDGQEVVIDDGGLDRSWPPLQRMRGNYRAKMYLERLPGYEIEPLMFCGWALERWNADGGVPPLSEVSLSFVTTHNALPGEAPSTHRRHLATWPLPGTSGERLSR